MDNIKTIAKLISIECKSKAKFIILVLTASYSFLIIYFFSSGSNLLSIVDQISSLTAVFVPGNFTNSTQKFHLIWFPRIFIFCTAVITSISFSEFKESRSAQFFISLPASKIEKWLAKCLLYIGLIPLTFVLIYQVFALATYSWDNFQVKFKLTDPFLWKYYTLILLVQCFLFSTSVLFKKNSLYKTILLSFAGFIIYNLIQLISFLIIRDDIDLFNSNGIPGLNSLNGLIDKAGYQVFEEFSKGMSTIHFEMTSIISLSVVFLLLSYILFSELET